MIRINLLPEDYRKSERTAPKLFAATLLGVISVCSILGWFGYVYFGHLANLSVEEAAVAENLASKKKMSEYYDSLVQEKTEYSKRSKTIQSISKSRVRWARIMDELIDVVNNNGDTERHLAWFKSITVRPGDNKKRGYTLRCPGSVQGNTLAKLANFHDDISNAPFFRNVLSKSAPAGTVQRDSKRIPPEALFFNLEIVFKPTQKWQRDELDAEPKKGE